jgi:antitoxin MazE
MVAARAQLAKWGNSLAVRIPKGLAEKAALHEGDCIVLEVEKQGVVAMTAVDRPKTLDDLIAQITPENVHREQEWGNPVGAEIW